MEYISLGKSGLQVSRLGFGCAPMGMHAWGSTNEEELVKAVPCALEKGVNLFDTADIYGLGVSETILGQALKNRRKEAVIATKFGVKRSESGNTFYENSPKWINCALNDSLKRLNTDYIDLYQLHYWDGVTPFDIIFETLEKARSEGKIRYYGITNIDLSEIPRDNLPDGLVSFSYKYSLVDRENESKIKRINELFKLTFLSWGSLGEGVLCGKYNASTKFPEDDRRNRAIYENFHGQKLQRNLNILSEMKNVLQHYKDKTLAQLAIRWILDYLKFSVALVGIKKPQQIIDSCGAFNWNMRLQDILLMDEISK